MLSDLLPRLALSPGPASTTTGLPIPPDYLRCAVPLHMGGLGGAPAELGELMRSLCDLSVSAGLVFWSQRLAIEFLVQSFNGAVREHLLPDMLGFGRAAAIPLSLDAPHLIARSIGRGLRVNGQVPTVVNARAEGFSVIAPVLLRGVDGWAVFRSEEDGIVAAGGNLVPRIANTHPAKLTFAEVPFREDEWLGDRQLLRKIEPARAALNVLHGCLIADANTWTR